MRGLLAGAVLLGLASAGTLSVPVRKQIRASEADKIRQRADDPFIDLQAINNFTGYFADIGVGTPPQVITFHLDTGSSDTWVNLEGNDFCNGTGSLFAPAPDCGTQFDPEDSSTYETVERGGFKIGYLDGSTAKGDYFNDTLTIQNNTVTQQRLGLARTSVSPTGIMGLGMSVGVAARKKYPVLIDNLVSQGIIETAVFSLYLDALTADVGTFLFGGIDTKKYIGDLASLPLVADTIHGSDNVTSYAVDLEGFSVDGISTPDLKTKAIFDTGATLAILPERIVKPIYDELGVVTIHQIPTPFIDCSIAKKKKKGKKDFTKSKFSFEFKGKTINVPIEEMVVDSLADKQYLFNNIFFQDLFKDMDKVCLFGIASTDKFQTRDEGDEEPEYALLGDTFLRSAYVVYDLAGQRLALGQAHHDSDESNIVALKSSGDVTTYTGVNAATVARGPSAIVAAAVALFASVAAL